MVDNVFNCKPRGYVVVCGVDRVGAFGVTATGEIFFKPVDGPYAVIPWNELDKRTEVLSRKQKADLSLRATSVRKERQLKYGSRLLAQG